MTTIHMETDVVYEQGRKMVYTASDLLTMLDRLNYALRDLRYAWNGPSATNRIYSLEKAIRSIGVQTQALDELGRRVMREVDEWVNVDRTELAYLTALKKSFNMSEEDIKKAVAGTWLASTLRWTAKRPNSIVFTGPNWMRKAIGIREATRVIKPSNLAKGMAIVGVAESIVAGAGAAKDAYEEYWHEDAARAISAATVDGGFRTALTAVGAVGIPLLLGAVVSAVGLPVIAAGAVVIGGSVVLGLAYSKLVEAPVWELWKQSTLRTEVIEAGKRTIDRISNYIGDLKDRAIQEIGRGFSSFIENITTIPPISPNPVPALP